MIQNDTIVCLSEGYVRIKGNTYLIPEHVIKSNFSSVTIINNKCYINGYKVTDEGEFKRSLIALWHLFF